MKLTVWNITNAIFSLEPLKRRFLEVYDINARDRASEINKIIDSHHLSEDHFTIAMIFALDKSACRKH